MKFNMKCFFCNAIFRNWQLRSSKIGHFNDRSELSKFVSERIYDKIIHWFSLKTYRGTISHFIGFRIQRIKILFIRFTMHRNKIFKLSNDISWRQDLFEWYHHKAKWKPIEWYLGFLSSQRRSWFKRWETWKANLHELLH